MVFARYKKRYREVDGLYDSITGKLYNLSDINCYYRPQAKNIDIIKSCEECYWKQESRIYVCPYTNRCPNYKKEETTNEKSLL